MGLILVLGISLYAFVVGTAQSYNILAPDPVLLTMIYAAIGVVGTVFVDEVSSFARRMKG